MTRMKGSRQLFLFFLAFMLVSAAVGASTDDPAGGGGKGTTAAGSGGGGTAAPPPKGGGGGRQDDDNGTTNGTAVDLGKFIEGTAEGTVHWVAETMMFMVKGFKLPTDAPADAIFALYKEAKAPESDADALALGVPAPVDPAPKDIDVAVPAGTKVGDYKAFGVWAIADKKSLGMVALPGGSSSSEPPPETDSTTEGGGAHQIFNSFTSFLILACSALLISVRVN